MRREGWISERRLCLGEEEIIGLGSLKEGCCDVLAKNKDKTKRAQGIGLALLSRSKSSLNTPDPDNHSNFSPI